MKSMHLRKLAIRLACIHVEDRLWVLAQLTPNERETVNALLAEISALGLDKDPAVIAAVISAPATRSAPSMPSSEDAMLYDRFSQLPHPFWGALLMQRHSVFERQMLMDRLPEGPLIRRWQHLLSDQLIPPALVAALVAHVETREGGHVAT